MIHGATHLLKTQVFYHAFCKKIEKTELYFLKRLTTNGDYFIKETLHHNSWQGSRSGKSKLGMSVLKSEDAKKWINSFMAICCVILCYTVIAFWGQLGEWFDLEAKIKHFEGVGQGIGILSGLSAFIFLAKNRASSTLMHEVFEELTKVVWPDRETVVRITIIVIIGVSVLSSIFVGVDYIFRQLLEQIY